jgi:hypothetical protein
MAGAARELVGRLPDAAGVPLKVLAVAGVMATCYRPPRASSRSPVHVLQFGSRMAALQLDAPLGSDTSGREMRRHGWDARYGDTPRARMACVVAHEVAHLLDHLGNGHQPRRSHGETFRRQLARLHEAGAVATLIEWMRHRDPDPDLDYPVAARPLERRPARPRRRRRRSAYPGLEPGDRVSFTDQADRRRTGTVLRVNRVTVSVHEDGEPASRWWRVPPRLLRHV